MYSEPGVGSAETLLNAEQTAPGTGEILLDAKERLPGVNEILLGINEILLVADEILLIMKEILLGAEERLPGAKEILLGVEEILLAVNESVLWGWIPFEWPLGLAERGIKEGRNRNMVRLYPAFTNSKSCLVMRSEGFCDGGTGFGTAAVAAAGRGAVFHLHGAVVDVKFIL